MSNSHSFTLDGKLVLVTGATRGIGRAVAIGAAAAGAELIITGRTTGALEEVDAVSYTHLTLPTMYTV